MDFDVEELEQVDDIGERENIWVEYARASKDFKIKFLFYVIYNYICNSIKNNDTDVTDFIFKILEYYKILDFYENVEYIYGEFSSYSVFNCTNTVSVKSLNYYLNLLKTKTPRYYDVELSEIFEMVLHRDNIPCIIYMIDNYILDYEAVDYYNSLEGLTRSPKTYYAVFNHIKDSFSDLLKNVPKIAYTINNIIKPDMEEIDRQIVDIYLYIEFRIRDKLYILDYPDFNKLMSTLVYKYRQLYLHFDDCGDCDESDQADQDDEVLDDFSTNIDNVFQHLLNTVFDDKRISDDNIIKFIDDYIFNSLLHKSFLMDHLTELIKFLWKLSERYNIYGIPINKKNLSSSIQLTSDYIDDCHKNKDKYLRGYLDILQKLIETAPLESVALMIKSKNKFNKLNARHLQICLEHAARLNRIDVVEFINQEIRNKI
jgi:hypothetical protein